MRSSTTIKKKQESCKEVYISIFKIKIRHKRRVGVFVGTATTPTLPALRGQLAAILSSPTQNLITLSWNLTGFAKAEQYIDKIALHTVG